LALSGRETVRVDHPELYGKIAICSLQMIEIGVLFQNQSNWQQTEQGRNIIKERTVNVRSGRIEESLGSQETGRDDKCTSSIAVGSKGFVDKFKSALIGSVSGRKVEEAGEGYQLREHSVPYKGNLDVKNEDIGPENRYFWDIIVD